MRTAENLCRICAPVGLRVLLTSVTCTRQLGTGWYTLGSRHRIPHVLPALRCREKPGDWCAACPSNANPLHSGQGSGSANVLLYGLKGLHMKPAASTSSNAPVQKECSIPGKTGWVIWRTLFEIDEQYVPIKAIGKGAYGVVCSAENLLTKEKVAIKKITNAFSHVMDARRTLREVKLLRHLRHTNVMAIRDIMQPVSLSNFTDLYVVSELMDTDLHQIIRSPQPLTDDHFQYFIYQVNA